MTPLRIKFIRELTGRGRAERTIHSDVAFGNAHAFHFFHSHKNPNALLPGLSVIIPRDERAKT